MRRLLLFGVSSLLSRYVRVESDIDLDTGFLVVVPHYGLIFIYIGKFTFHIFLLYNVVSSTVSPVYRQRRRRSSAILITISLL